MLEFLKGYLIENYVTLVLLLGTVILILPKPSFLKTVKKSIFILTGLLLLLSLADYTEMLMSKLSVLEGNNFTIRMLCAELGYILRPLLVIIPISLIIKERIVVKTLAVLEIINVIIYLVNWFIPIAFRFDHQNAFHREILGLYPHIISMIGLIFFVRMMFNQFGKDRENSGIVYFLSVSMFISLAIATFAVDSVNYKIMDPAVALVILYFYSYIMIESMRNHDEMQKRMLTNTRDALLASQIQPHFLYNTLNTIYYLCKNDPDLAADTVVDFSGYLRGNMEMGMHTDQLIPFEKDIEHARFYSNIETLRFENIKVDYLLEDTDFLIPSITVQPMVENAVKHGVRNKKDGHILVRSRKADHAHILEIIDNGIGFVQDPSTEKDMKHTGIGISNVRQRIEGMTGGTLELHMVKDQGTTVTITIPESG